MNPLFPRTRLFIALITLALSSAFVMSAPPLLAGAATQPAPGLPKPRPNRQAIQQEIAAQPEGIHTISDGTIVIKSGRGTATVHADLHGCGTGYTGNPAPAVDLDNDLMAGVFSALFMNPKEGEKLGIGADLAAKIKDAYNFIDYEHTHPTPVLKLYEQYVKSLEGAARADAEKALMDKVRSVGEAYFNAEAKKLRDVKALLTPDQIKHLQRIGAKMIAPLAKPVA